MENLTISEKIKIMSSRAGLSLSALARVLGDSPQNFTQKVNRDNFRVNELEKIAAACGYEMKIEFIEKNGGAG